MTVTLLDILLAIVGVVVAPFLIQGVVRAKSRTGRAFQVVMGVALVGVFLIVWGNTGRDPLQWTYCFANRSAPSCKGIHWPTMKLRWPAAAQPAPKISQPSPPHQTPAPDAANPPAPAIEATSGPIASPIWRPSGGQSLGAFLANLSVRQTLAIAPADLTGVKTPPAQDAVRRANAALPLAEALFAEAVANAAQGAERAQANAARKPRVYVGYGLEGAGPFRGELDAKGAPSGPGRLGWIKGDSYSLQLGRFVAEGDTKNGYYLRPDGAYLSLGAPAKGTVLFASRSRSWMDQRTDGPVVIATADGRNCVADLKYPYQGRGTGFGLCRSRNGELYAGQLLFDQMPAFTCQIESSFCFNVVRRGTGAMFSPNGAVLREGNWNDPIPN